MWNVQRNLKLLAALLAFGAVASGCAQKVFDPVSAAGPGSSAVRAASTRSDDATGAVFLMSNAAGGNGIIVYARNSDGGLTLLGTEPTGGNGSGGGLGNQASLLLTNDGTRLYAVNAGSNTVSAFAVSGTHLEPIGSAVPSGGTTPISLTLHQDLLYVLNAGGAGNIAGFRVDAAGALTPIAGSSRPLGSADAGPAEIQFTPRGDVLVVTEKNTSTITTYAVNGDGTVGAPVTRPAAGDTPFGFSFNQRGDLVVSEAGGGPGGATASSYRVGPDGVQLISGPVATTQSAACWIAISQNGQLAYTTNTGSGTLSRLEIGVGGVLTLDAAVAGITGPGSAPQDAAFTPGGRFLYIRNNDGTIGAFRVEGNGALSSLGNVGVLPAGANGIAAL